MVWLVPAYGIVDLRVNAQWVSSSMALDEQSVFEFGGVRIDATILDGSAAGGAVPSRKETLVCKWFGKPTCQTRMTRRA